jgi:hypothetical protein
VSDSENLAANKTKRTYVLSWNMQGSGSKDSETKWSALTGVLSKTKAIVACCLQEAGSAPHYKLESSYGGFKGFGSSDVVSLYSRKLDTSRVMAVYHYPWAQSDDGNERCSLAVVLIGSFNDAPKPLLVPSGHARRPLLGVNWNGVDLFSIHANSSNKASLSARGLLTEVSGVFNTWIVAGDYNCPHITMTGVVNASYVRAPDPLALRLDENFNPLASQGIDYAVQSERPQGNGLRLSQHRGIAVGTGVLKSDHPATAFQILSTKGQ